jgi:integrase
VSKSPTKRAPVSGIVVYQKRGRTKWSYRLELDRHPLTDQRQFEYRHSFASEDEAWTEAVKAKAKRETGQQAVKPAKRTVADFLNEWLTSTKDSIKRSTYVNYTDYCDAYVLPTIGKRKLQNIDVPTLNTFYRHLLDAGRCKKDTNTLMYEHWRSRRSQHNGSGPTPMEISKACGTTIYAARAAVLRYRRGRVPKPKPPGLAPKTVKNVHRMLHRALSDAVAWRYLEYNPAEHASLPRERRKGRGQRGATWTPEQLAAWLKVAVGDRDAGMWVLAATTGMRRSELGGAEREFLDLDAGLLEIEDTRVVVDGKAEDSDGKTESSRRTISLDPLTVAYLRQHLMMLDKERQAFGSAYHDAGKLLCHGDGQPIHPDTITRRFNRLVDQAGVPRIRLHDVRHTYATVSLDNGIDPKIVSDRIGHANMAYTLQIYTHRSTGRDRDASKKVADVIFGEDWERPTGI